MLDVQLPLQHLASFRQIRVQETGVRERHSGVARRSGIRLFARTCFTQRSPTVYGPAGTTLSVISSRRAKTKSNRFRRELISFCGAIYPTAIMTCAVGPGLQQLGQHSHDGWLLFFANRRLAVPPSWEKANHPLGTLHNLTRTFGKLSVSSVAA